MSFNYEGVGKNIAVVKNKNNDKVKDKNVYKRVNDNLF